MAVVTYQGADWTYEEVERGGLIWMDRNLGATQAATSATDANAYGHLFQWGRGDDGGQLINSSTTTTRYTNNAAGNLFVINSPTPYDWRNPQNDGLWQNGLNIPIPTGWRLPTSAELNTERLSWGSNGLAGAYESTLKWSASGYRDLAGAVLQQGTVGRYWSSDRGSGQATYLYIPSSGARTYTTGWRVYGMSVRLVKLPTSSIKSILGLDRSKIKSFNGLAIDKIKQVNNLT